MSAAGSKEKNEETEAVSAAGSKEKIWWDKGYYDCAKLRLREYWRIAEFNRSCTLVQESSRQSSADLYQN